MLLKCLYMHRFPIITHTYIESLKTTVRIIDTPLKPHNLADTSKMCINN